MCGHKWGRITFTIPKHEEVKSFIIVLNSSIEMLNSLVNATEYNECENEIE